MGYLKGSNVCRCSISDRSSVAIQLGVGVGIRIGVGIGVILGVGVGLELG